MADLTVSFELYNEETVRILKEEDPDLLPDYSVNSSKDLAYNKKQVTSAITSGIIKGESIPKIAANLQSTIENLNESSAVSAARTAAIAAQNTGSLSSMKRLAEMGVEVQKEWVATLDVRTRPSHRALDGQRRDLDEAFSNGLQYPGASGNPAERWNCRCKIKAYMPKYDSEDEPRLTYSEWEAYKKATGNTAKKITENQYAEARKQTRNKHAGQYEDDLYGEINYEYDEDTGLLKIITEEGEIEYDFETGRAKYSEGDSAEEYLFDTDEYNQWLKKLGLSKTSKLKNTQIGRVKNIVSDNAEKAGVEYKQVLKRETYLNEEQIIARISGGDKTGGSCASAAYAYCGQKAGYDVLDFRGGVSRQFFRKRSNTKLMSQFSDVKSYTVVSNNSISAGKAMLAKVEVGKQYVLHVGKHAAVVTKTQAGTYKYLELQSQTKSGWRDFDSAQDKGDTLTNRFKCSSENKNSSAYMEDVDSLTNSKEFIDVLGYINTEESKQNKGAGGYEK